MAKITRVPNSRFGRKQKGSPKAGPKPTGARADRRISNTKSFLSKQNQNKPTSPGST